MIKEINITAFRGIHYWNLDLNNKNLVIFGENGTGKSSLIDAFEFFFTGNLQYLTSVQKISKKTLPTVGFTENDMNVDIFFNNTEHFERKYLGLIQPTPTLEYFCKMFSIAQNPSFILRRNQLLEFILNIPSERFKRIGNLIGIGDLDKDELTFKETFKHFQKIIQEKESIIDNSLTSIAKILQIKKSHLNNLLENINKYLNIRKMNLLPNLEQLDEYCQLLALKFPFPESSEKIKEGIVDLDKIRNILESIGPEKIFEECQKYYSNCIEFDKKYPSSPSNLQFLNRGLEIVKDMKEEEINCPFCEQNIIRIELQNRVKERLSLYKKLTSESSRLENLEQHISVNLRNVSNKITRIFEDNISLDLRKSLNLIDKSLNLILTRIKKKKPVELNDIKKLQKNIDLSHKILRRSINTFELELLKHNLSKEQLHIYEIIRELSQIQPFVKNLLNESKMIEMAREKVNITKKMFEGFSNVRKSEIQNIYNEIQSTIQYYYTKIHPDEDLKNILLKMTRPGSTILTVDFLDKNQEDPRAYASEGHLDSIGLCIFLAFNKKFLFDFPFMILDDVLSSVDANHRLRITNLILDEFVDKQLIITTHDLIWFNEIKARQRAKRIQNKFINREITNWHHTTGPIIRNSPPKKEFILTQIESNNHHVGTQIRIYMENVLKNICCNLECSTTYKPDNKHTLGVYLDSVKSRINTIFRPSCALKPVLLGSINRFDSISFMANILSHSNVEYDAIVMSEIEEFANSVFDFETSFQCSDCNKDLIYSKIIAKIKCKTAGCVCTKQTDTR